MDDELALLLHDDEKYSMTTKYLHPLIGEVLDLFEMPDTDHIRLEKLIISDIPIATERFLGSPKTLKARHRFCVYFSWYIAQRVNAEDFKKKS